MFVNICDVFEYLSVLLWNNEFQNATLASFYGFDLESLEFPIQDGLTINANCEQILANNGFN